MTLKITDELTALREQADELGIKYHHRAGEAKLKELINAYLADDSDLKVDDDVAASKKTEKIVPMTQQEYRKSTDSDRKRLAGRLVRCRITCMDPAKREWKGEIISVGSAKLGTFKKFIPFDGREYHIPQIIYDVLKERKYSTFYTVRNHRGVEIRKSRLAPAFAIEVLPPLTPAEIKDLKKQQALAGGWDGDN